MFLVECSSKSSILSLYVLNTPRQEEANTTCDNIPPSLPGIVIGLITKRLLGALKTIILLSAAVGTLGFFLFALMLTIHPPISSSGLSWLLGHGEILQTV